MKVRQSVSVTSELGDQNNLASFDGEFRENSSSTLDFWFGSSSVKVIFRSTGFSIWHKWHPPSHPPTKHTKCTHTHFLLYPASIERQPITRPLVPHNEILLCQQHSAPTHTLLTCCGKYITAANQPTLPHINFQKGVRFGLRLCDKGMM